MHQWKVKLLAILILCWMGVAVSEMTTDDWQCPVQTEGEGSLLSIGISCFHDHIEIEWSSASQVYVNEIHYSCFGAGNASVGNGTVTHQMPTLGAQTHSKMIPIPSGTIYCKVQGCYEELFLVVYSVPVRTCSIPQANSYGLFSVTSSSHMTPQLTGTPAPTTNPSTTSAYSTSVVYVTVTSTVDASPVTSSPQDVPETTPGDSAPGTLGLTLSVVAVTGFALTTVAGITITVVCIVVNRIRTVHRSNSQTEVPHFFGYNDSVDPDYQPVQVQRSVSMAATIYSDFDYLETIDHPSAVQSNPSQHGKVVLNGATLQEEGNKKPRPPVTLEAEEDEKSTTTTQGKYTVSDPASFTDEGRGLMGVLSDETVNSTDETFSSISNTGVCNSHNIDESGLIVGDYVHIENTQFSSNGKLLAWSAQGAQEERNQKYSLAVEMEDQPIIPAYSPLIIGGSATESSTDCDSHGNPYIEHCNSL